MHHDGTAQSQLGELTLVDHLVDGTARQEAIDVTFALLTLAVDAAKNHDEGRCVVRTSCCKNAHRAMACRSFDGFQSLSI